MFAVLVSLACVYARATYLSHLYFAVYRTG